jgi:murein tripeptide amidase MpaA
MEGFIEYILGDELEARNLRNTYVFKIIPMLNPDGVIVGNYRCSLSGLDLNRQWQTPSVKLSPEIYAMKEMVRKTLECREIHLFVDMHGHSRQKNLFMYGCSTSNYALAASQLSQATKSLDKRGNGLGSGPSHHREKVLPFLLS